MSAFVFRLFADTLFVLGEGKSEVLTNHSAFSRCRTPCWDLAISKSDVLNAMLALVSDTLGAKCELSAMLAFGTQQNTRFSVPCEHPAHIKAVCAKC